MLNNLDQFLSIALGSRTMGFVLVEFNATVGPSLCAVIKINDNISITIVFHVTEVEESEFFVDQWQIVRCDVWVEERPDALLCQVLSSPETWNENDDEIIKVYLKLKKGEISFRTPFEY